MPKPRGKFSVGTKHGTWTIIETPYKSKQVLAQCECGIQMWKWTSNLSKPSCCGNKTTTPWERVYSLVKTGAVRRGLAWDLSFDQWREFAVSDCTYCGGEPSNSVAIHKIYYNGIDRLDSSEGYNEDNCVPCCKICNRAKSDTPLPEFLDWIKRVHERSI